ncbi:VanZ like family protein [Amycolatopsis marina]|uniref:VanZ like family protein n=1 Tax=Amycolatopsis marina TaxID=490629 RepID=A0A1I0VQV9_9PSEU|nr:VanZ family protein [Amycolatopsis marina]SFA78373.1 VanZ like family protein [Amycolatopsis marina]
MTTAQATALQYGFLGFLAVWATLLVPQLLLHQAHYGRVQPARVTRTAVVTLYACLALAVVLLPLPSAGDPHLSQNVQLVPLQWIADVVRESQSSASPITTLAFEQLAMNVLLFVPLGVFAKLLWRRRFAGAVGIGLGASALIEITQLTANFGTAPFAYRIFDVDDLLSNTTGAALGWILAALFALLRSLSAVSASTAVTDVLPAPATAPGPARPVSPAVPVYAGRLAAAHAGPGARQWQQQR